MKVVVFQVVSNGVDGRDKTSVNFSHINEENRDAFYEGLGKTRGYYSKREVVLDLKQLYKEFKNKLNGNDKMILEMFSSIDIDNDKQYMSYHGVSVDL
ncbi:MAG: hypothetical protein GWN01_12160 [Nitrosopumilaceae archaeon]|nr:hypothetical protein [Nitrosopumilaceae archaeon]NIU88048.1 hypothetical protein [Nitrosopumilaceae archaeon]NIX62232.1 hypothetical protein [Nitrosopumilaceae archaeon]